MDDFNLTYRRPTTFESSAVQSILKQSTKQYSFLRDKSQVIRCGDNGILLYVGDPSSVKQSILIEIHMDEVAIQLLSPVRSTGNSIGIPVWKGKALGNSKYHVWGEKMDIISMPSQKYLGTGFIMQNPPHCETLESKHQRNMGDEYVWIRTDSKKTDTLMKKEVKKGRDIVAMFSSKIQCNKEYCIGPGIDNSVSWYALCEAFETLYKKNIPIKNCYIQLSTGEEIGKSVALLNKTELKHISHFICLDTDVAEMPGLDPDKGCTIYTNNPDSKIYSWLKKQKRYIQVPRSEIVGGTNELLYSDFISSSVNIGIPIVAMHSAHEQVSHTMIKNTIQLLKRCLKLSQSIGN